MLKMNALKGKIWAVGLVVFLIGISLYLRKEAGKSTPDEKATDHAHSSKNSKSEKPQKVSEDTPETNNQHPTNRASLKDAHKFLQFYGAPENSPFRDLVYLTSVLQVYTSHLKGQTLLPTDSNKSIVEVLRGKNAKNLEFIPADFKYLNSEGEIVDRWNTPLSFHFKNINQPEIRSAGEDRELWTDDDLVFEN